MNRITDRLCVGDVRDAGAERAYDRHGVDAVVRLTHTEPAEGYPDGIAVHDHPIRDGPGNDPTATTAAVEATAGLLDGGRTVLVHCSAGASRSPAVAAGALALHRDRGIDAALERVRGVRTVRIHPTVREHASRAVERLRDRAGDGDRRG